MRILDKDSIKVGLRQLGFAEDDYQKFEGLIRRPNGIILVTGPTGSGKTTSLYAALNELNTPGPQDHHGRGPGRVLPAGDQPGRDPAQHRAGLCPRHSRHAASGPEHHSGGRDARPGDGADGNSGIFDWTLGFQYTTYERCAQCYYTSDRHGRAPPTWSPAASSPSWHSVWSASFARNASSRIPRRRPPCEAAGITPEMAANGNLHARDAAAATARAAATAAGWASSN